MALIASRTLGTSSPSVAATVTPVGAEGVASSVSVSRVEAGRMVRAALVDFTWDHQKPNCSLRATHTRYSPALIQYTLHGYLGGGKYRSTSFVWQAGYGWADYMTRYHYC